MAWNYKKSKTVKTPRVDDKKPKDKNAVKGTKPARKQKPVTWT
jgi:hypothetical protein